MARERRKKGGGAVELIMCYFPVRSNFFHHFYQRLVGVLDAIRRLT